MFKWRWTLTLRVNRACFLFGRLTSSMWLTRTPRSMTSVLPTLLGSASSSSSSWRGPSRPAAWTSRPGETHTRNLVMRIRHLWRPHCLLCPFNLFAQRSASTDKKHMSPDLYLSLHNSGPRTCPMRFFGVTALSRWSSIGETTTTSTSTSRRSTARTRSTHQPARLVCWMSSTPKLLPQPFLGWGVLLVQKLHLYPGEQSSYRTYGPCGNYVQRASWSSS